MQTLPNTVDRGAMAIPLRTLIMMTLMALITGCQAEQKSRSENANHSEQSFEDRYILPLSHALDNVINQISHEPTLVDRQTEFIDLNDNGFLDALVMVEGSSFCASDGCTMLIFKYEPNTGDYHIVSSLKPILKPVLVSESFSNGWRDIVAVVLGPGGARSEARYVKYVFDSQSYPQSSRDAVPLNAGDRPHGSLLF